MSIGGSVFLIAAGAILRYAIKDTLDWVNLDVVGLVLMIAGALGLVLSLIWAALASRRPVGTSRYDDGRYSPLALAWLDRLTAGKRAAEGDLVRVLEVGADRQAAGQSGDRHLAAQAARRCGERSPRRSWSGSSRARPR